MAILVIKRCVCLMNLSKKRIDLQLFENEQAVMLAIEYSGGSPRQLLRILEQANWFTLMEDGKIRWPISNAPLRN